MLSLVDSVTVQSSRENGIITVDQASGGTMLMPFDLRKLLLLSVLCQSSPENPTHVRQLWFTSKIYKELFLFF